MLHSKFFVVSGKGISRTSKLNAFDKALMDAGIAQCNLVPVSSILPEGAVEVKPKEIDIGSITFVVLGRCDGYGKGIVGSGVAWAFVEDHNGREFGMVAEDDGCKTKKFLENSLEKMLLEMAEARRVTIKNMNSRIEVLDIPDNSYGCVVSALVYV